MFKRYADESRNEYGRETANGNLQNDDLKVGCLQRIALATEAMAKNHVRLMEERDRYERWYRNEQASGQRLARSNAALRGYIKRLKAAK